MMNLLALMTTVAIGCGASCRYYIKAIAPVQELDNGWKSVQVEYIAIRKTTNGKEIPISTEDLRKIKLKNKWRSYTFAHCEKELVAHSKSSKIKNFKGKSIWRKGGGGTHPFFPNNSSINNPSWSHWYQICNEVFDKKYPQEFFPRTLIPYNQMSHRLRFWHPITTVHFLDNKNKTWTDNVRYLLEIGN